MAVDRWEDAARLNNLQDSALDAISTARDRIHNYFTEHGDPHSLVDSTLKRLCSYFSERSQAVSYLVSSGYVWDGEIVLRSFYETNARVWFICLTEPANRETLVKEFWGDLAAVHNYKRGKRAVAAVELSKRQGNPEDEVIFSALTREDLFEFSQENKKTKKKIEQKWSFTEIVNHLSKNSPSEFNAKDMGVLLHSYGIASHLIHADESALDLMLDRELRTPDERDALAKAHVCRIFSDQVSLWVLSATTLAFRFGQTAKIEGVLRDKFQRVQTLSEPFLERFNEHQAAFYAQHAPTK